MMNSVDRDNGTAGSGARSNRTGASDRVAAAPVKIGLLDHCGTGNLGDDATVSTVLQLIRRRLPAAKLVGLSLDPVDSQKRHGIPCFAIRQSVYPHQQEWASTVKETGGLDRLKARLAKYGLLYRAAKAVWRAGAGVATFARETIFLARSYRLARQLDLLVICGSGQLLDWGGPWTFPYTLFKWTVLARLAGAKCIFLNNGAGPLEAPLSRWFVMRALSMADYISTRDGFSAEFLRKLGFKGEIAAVADSVWGLRPERMAPPTSAPRSGLVFAIAPMPYGDASRHHRDDLAGYRHLIDGLADFGAELLRRGHEIRLFSSDIWFDAKAIADLQAAICAKNPTESDDRVRRESVANTDEFLAAISRVDCSVTCRFHGVIFASLLDVPSIALAPHHKVTTLMADMNLSKYCVDIANFTAADLTARVDDLVAHMDDVKAQIRGELAKRRSILDLQFDSLFRPSYEGRKQEESSVLEMGAINELERSAICEYRDAGLER